jgi:ERCC4 domain
VTEDFLARPGVRTPTARASGVEALEILVDVHERYPWKFSTQQVTTVRRPLVAGDYAVESGGRIVAAVERKSLIDLTSSLTGGRLKYALAELASLPHAAVVVEERYSAVFALTQVRPTVVADGLAECQARFPTVPIIFAETRPLAQQWAYRFLAACLVEADAEAHGAARIEQLPTAPPAPPRPPSTREIRAWAQAAGLIGPARGGRLAASVVTAFHDAHPDLPR